MTGMLRILTNPILVPYRPSVWEILLCAGILSVVVAGIVVLIAVLARRRKRK